MSEARRLLHLIDTGGPGGAETVLDTVVAGLPEQAWRSLVVVPGEGWLSGRLEERGVDVEFAPSGGTADLRYLRRLRSLIHDFDPSLVHAHLLGAGVYGSMAAALAGDVPLVCTLHGRPDIPDPDPLRWLKARVLGRRRNRVVYVSDDLRRYAEPLLGLPPRQGLVIRNGIRFREPKPTGDERAACGAGPGDILVGAVGNVRPAKDYGTLVEAAAIVRRSRPDVRFAIAGDARSAPGELVRKVDELGLQDSLRFLGFRDDVPALVDAFDLFVSSSYTEGLPLATVEAVALGTPVVLTRVGGVPEIVESGRTGTLVPPRDPPALARGILQALADPQRTRTMARAASAEVRERFGADAMCEAYQSLYRRMLTTE